MFFFPFLYGQHCLFKSEDIDSFSLLKEEWPSTSTEVGERGGSTIPVVFHIVWKEEEQNISDLQIQSQLDALNRDYRKRNIEIDELFHSTGIEGADVEIEFCLAKKYEENKEVLGIIRKKTDIENIGLSNNIFYSQQGGSSAWNTKQYLNVWICDLPEGILGYSSSPSDYGHSKDGIVMSYQYLER